MDIKQGITGTIITIVIGGSAYAVNQADVITNFSADTGLSQSQAEAYINSIDEDELTSFTEVGKDYIEEGREFISIADDIDCNEYIYEWESGSLTCEAGKSQLRRIGQNEMDLGRAYIQLDHETANEVDIQAAIELIDIVNTDYNLPIIVKILDTGTIIETQRTNSYNKSLLQAATQ